MGLKYLAFCKSEFYIVLLSFFFPTDTEEETNAEDYLKEDSLLIDPSQWAARSEEKGTKAPSKGQQW